MRRRLSDADLAALQLGFRFTAIDGTPEVGGTTLTPHPTKKDGLKVAILNPIMTISTLLFVHAFIAVVCRHGGRLVCGPPASAPHIHSWWVGGWDSVSQWRHHFKSPHSPGCPYAWAASVHVIQGHPRGRGDVQGKANVELNNQE